ncbi:hypothetical protein [Chryseobacterium lactis]|uniref:hypothetical protein n=1 Tax=Chryseobacterium lactis TaxID=1241981 RepID=UPI001628B100|nr:hypothetical protein [Chryseobacterium lactis]
MDTYLDKILSDLAKTFGGLEFFKSDEIKRELLKYNGKELLVYFFNHPNMKFKKMQFLLLTIPEIWKDFNLEDWIYIIYNVKRPENYHILFNEEAYFEDIKFLYKYIEVDSIKLYKQYCKNEDIIILDKVISDYAYDMFKTELDIENFEDFTYGDVHYFKEMKERLLTQGAQETNYKNDLTDIDALRNYIKYDHI